MEWINVKDQLPDCLYTGNWDGKKSDLLLCFSENKFILIATAYSGFIDGQNFFDWYEQNDFEITNVTHWMPLPKPPLSL